MNDRLTREVEAPHTSPPRGMGPRFDVGPLLAELDALDLVEWEPYPNSVLGQRALPLISVGGRPNFDFPIAGPLQPQLELGRLPALTRMLEVLGAGSMLGRCRLVRTAAGTRVPAQEPWSHHWSLHRALCLPLVSEDTAIIEAGRAPVPVRVGRLWQPSASGAQLRNDSSRDCVHLVVERREPFQLAARASELWSRCGAELPLVPYRFEVLEPEAFEAASAGILEAKGGDVRDPHELRALLEHASRSWRATFERFGHDSRGELSYRDQLLDFRDRVLVKLVHGSSAYRLAMLIATSLDFAPRVPAQVRRPPKRAKPLPAGERGSDFERPLFIVSAPRSGSTLLFNLLAQLPNTWTVGGESHEIIRGIESLHPAAHNYESDRLEASAATPATVAALHRSFASRLVDRRGQHYAELDPALRPSRVRLLEKTPANALRIPFLRAAFPDARFVHLFREARATTSSLVEGWRSRRFLAYRDLPDWPHRDWSFLLPPGWRNFADRPLIEIAAYQWRVANETIIRDLEELPSEDCLRLRYAELVANPRRVLACVAQFAGLELDDRLDAALSFSNPPLTHVTLSPPRPEKWRRHEHEFAPVMPILDLDIPLPSTLARLHTRTP